MISLQDYHILEGKYEDLIKEHASLGATLFIKDKMLNELSDTIVELKESIKKLQEDNDEAMKIEVRNDKNFNDVLDRKNRIIDKLKQQLVDIKYLDKNKVWDLVFKYPADEIDEKELINAICNLAIPITKDKANKIVDKIMELPVIKKQIEQWYKDTSPCCANLEVIELRKQIASEILNESEIK